MKKNDRDLLAGLAFSVGVHGVFCATYFLFEKLLISLTSLMDELYIWLFFALLIAALIVYILLQKKYNSPYLFCSALIGHAVMSAFDYLLGDNLFRGWDGLGFALGYIFLLFVISAILVVDLIRLVILSILRSNRKQEFDKTKKE